MWALAVLPHLLGAACRSTYSSVSARRGEVMWGLAHNAACSGVYVELSHSSGLTGSALYICRAAPHDTVHGIIALHPTARHDRLWCHVRMSGEPFCVKPNSAKHSWQLLHLLAEGRRKFKKNVSCATRFSANMKEIAHQSVSLISGLRTPELKWKRKFYRSVLVTEYNVLFNLPWVYSQILRVGKLLFAAWKETGCAYLWMKGLAQTLHPNKDHDPIWLPRHMVLFLRQRESVADSHLGRTE